MAYYEVFFRPDGFNVRQPLEDDHLEVLTGNEDLMSQVALYREVGMDMFRIPPEYRPGDPMARYVHASALGMMARNALDDIHDNKAVYIPAYMFLSELRRAPTAEPAQPISPAL